ncbi:MAG: serine/threonine-protein kinase [Gaiellaceae bacterium]
MIGERFRIERRLGRGGMAAVYLAHDEELGRPVAVKVLESLAGEDESRRRFIREARLAARLTHPNIVTVYDAGEHDGAPYIVMEYVEGETLAELFARRGRLPPEEVVALGRQACAGLQHAHDAGLVHRDVKPQNLLVRSDGTLKISDFGIARAAEGTQITSAGTILGTAGYLAPEQAFGEEASAAADVYGLGAVLYEALTGRAPVRVESLAELPTAHLRPPAPVGEVGASVAGGLLRAVMDALARRPEERPASAAELADTLDGTAPEAPTVALRRRPEPLPRGGPERILAVAAAVVVAVVVAIAIAARDVAERPPTVPPVPQQADPEQQARALAEWLRENAEG